MSQRIEGRLARDPGGDPESRLWAAVVERAQEPERLDQTKKACIWRLMSIVEKPFGRGL
jgi:hypothetical protein